MVEFGAGGTITHTEVPETTPNGEAAEPPAAAPAAEDPIANAANPAAPNQRTRKRKAKGWFCPMCRQRKLHSTILFHQLDLLLLAYTSLLRITTTPPSKEEERDSDQENEKEDPSAQRDELPQVPAPAATTAQRLVGFTRPRFLRGLSRNRAEQDLERGLAAPVPAATA
jgi:hypothetical protein